MSVGRWLGTGLVVLAVGAFAAWRWADVQHHVAGMMATTQPAPTAVTLRVHAYEGYCEPQVAGFKDWAASVLHLDVTVTVTSSAAEEDQVAAARDRQADLLTPTNYWVGRLVKEGLVQPLDLKRVPHFNQVSPLLLDQPYYRVGDEVYAVPFLYGPYALAYDTGVVSSPTTYQVLWDPKYAGRVSISGKDALLNLYMVALMLKTPTAELFKMPDSRLAEVEQRLAALARTQVHDYWTEGYLDPSFVPQVVLGMDFGDGVRRINKAGKARWAVVIPDEGATAWVDSWSIVAGVSGVTLDAAYGFINYMTEARVQAEVCRKTGFGPSNFYTTRYLTTAEKVEFHVTDPNYLSRLIVVQPLAPADEERYLAAWKRATGREP